MFSYRPLLWSIWGRRIPLYTKIFVVESDINCRMRCYLFVETVQTIRILCAFAQIVLVPSHFHWKSEIMWKGWYLSETTRSFQFSSHPTQPLYGEWLESGGLIKVYTSKTTRKTFYLRLVQNRFWIKKWHWRTMSINPIIDRDLKSAKVHCWSKFGNPNLDRWWMMAWRSSKCGILLFLSWIWPWRSRSINSKNNMDLEQGVFLFWSKFGDSSLSGWQVIARTTGGYRTHRRTHRQTDRGNDNTWRPNLAWGKKYFTMYYVRHSKMHMHRVYGLVLGNLQMFQMCLLHTLVW